MLAKIYHPDKVANPTEKENGKSVIVVSLNCKVLTKMFCVFTASLSVYSVFFGAYVCTQYVFKKYIHPNFTPKCAQTLNSAMAKIHFSINVWSYVTGSAKTLHFE